MSDLGEYLSTDIDELKGEVRELFHHIDELAEVTRHRTPDGNELLFISEALSAQADHIARVYGV